MKGAKVLALAGLVGCQEPEVEPSYPPIECKTVTADELRVLVERAPDDTAGEFDFIYDRMSLVQEGAGIAAELELSGIAVGVLLWFRLGNEANFVASTVSYIRTRVPWISANGFQSRWSEVPMWRVDDGPVVRRWERRWQATLWSFGDYTAVTGTPRPSDLINGLDGVPALPGFEFVLEACFEGEDGPHRYQRHLVACPAWELDCVPRWTMPRGGIDYVDNSDDPSCWSTADLTSP